MYVQWYTVTRHLRESLGELEKAVEILLSRSPKLVLA